MHHCNYTHCYLPPPQPAQSTSMLARQSTNSKTPRSIYSGSLATIVSQSNVFPTRISLNLRLGGFPCYPSRSALANICTQPVQPPILNDEHRQVSGPDSRDTQPPLANSSLASSERRDSLLVQDTSSPVAPHTTRTIIVHLVAPR